MAKQTKKKHKKKQEFFEEPTQDDNFFFIAGYTSGGAPYGVTWEEMGLEPWQELEDEPFGFDKCDLPFD